MKTLGRELMAGGAASAAFVGLAVASPLAWWALLPLSLAVYGGVRLLLPLPVEPAAERPEAQRAAAVVATARAGADRLDGIAPRLRAEPASSLRGIAAALREMAHDVAVDAADAPAAAAFLSLHLASTLTVAERYAELAHRPLADARAKAQLADCERTLVVVRTAFEAHARSLVDSDLEALDLDRRVLEELVRMEEKLGAPEGNLPEKELS